MSKRGLEEFEGPVVRTPRVGVYRQTDSVVTINGESNRFTTSFAQGIAAGSKHYQYPRVLGRLHSVRWWIHLYRGSQQLNHTIAPSILRILVCSDRQTNSASTSVPWQPTFTNYTGPGHAILQPTLQFTYLNGLNPDYLARYRIWHDEHHELPRISHSDDGSEIPWDGFSYNAGTGEIFGYYYPPIHPFTDHFYTGFIDLHDLPCNFETYENIPSLMIANGLPDTDGNAWVIDYVTELKYSL